MMSIERRTVALMGATGTGKSDLAIRLAEKFDGEIVSMDSRQVYRGLDIGTGKVSPAEQRRVPHHLIDVLDPMERNSAGAHAARAIAIAERIVGSGKPVFFVGGTGLYFRALFRGLIDATVPEEKRRELREVLDGLPTEELHRRLEEIDPERASALSRRDRVRIVRSIEIALLTGRTYTQHVSDQRRPPRWEGLKVVLTLPRELLRDRIAERTRQMYEAGWVEEVRSLIRRGIRSDAPAMASLGYGIIARAIEAGADPEATLDEVIRLTQQYAKRQETFFRSERDALWFDVSRAGVREEIEGVVGRHLGL